MTNAYSIRIATMPLLTGCLLLAACSEEPEPAPGDHEPPPADIVEAIEDLQGRMGQLEVDVPNLADRTTIVESRTVPTGAIMPFAANAIPEGWVLCDGAALNRVEHADLFAVIGTSFGADENMFNVPDLRGEFVRGWDAGRGVDPDRVLGSPQLEQLRTHTHEDSGHSHQDLGHAHSYGDLHIPWPALPVFTALPWHREIVKALCAYDLIGFQTDEDLECFQDYIRREVGGDLCLSWRRGKFTFVAVGPRGDRGWRALLGAPE